jgi:hypothetical protein
MEERGGIAPKTAGKVPTDEHTWELSVEEQGIVIGDYPSKEQVVDVAVWMSMHRERVCLAQRANPRPKADGEGVGKAKRTIRNMLTELFRHVWPQ